MGAVVPGVAVIVLRGTALLAVLVLAACGAERSRSAPSPSPTVVTVAPEEAAAMTIAEFLRTDERFSSFRQLAAVTVSPMPGEPSWLDIWDWPGNRMGADREGVTVFVPTDQAFDALDASITSDLEALPNQIRYDWLGHHYVHRLYPSSDFEAGRQLTWRGEVEMTLDPLAWGGHPIVETDIRTANGYLHVIGGVVIPEAVRGASSD